jgi:hypothetical protein
MWISSLRSQYITEKPCESVNKYDITFSILWWHNFSFSRLRCSRTRCWGAYLDPKGGCNRRLRQMHNVGLCNLNPTWNVTRTIRLKCAWICCKMWRKTPFW